MAEKARLRVNFVINRPGWSGGARILARHARLLREDGHEIAVIGVPAPPPRVRERLRALFARSMTPRGLQSHFEAEGLPLRYARSHQRIGAEDVPDADIVIASFWRAAEWMLALPPEKGRKIYFIQHHEADFPHADRTRAAATYRGQAILFVVSNWLKTIMREQYGRDALLVPNAIDLAQFSPGGDRAKNETPVVGFLASTNATKRTDLAIAACEILKERFAALRAIALAGKEEAARTLPDWIERRINPPQDELANIYRACDLWLFTSEIEGYGLPLLEAMACGTPLVASPAGAAPDLIDGANSVLVNGYAAGAFAEAAAGVLSMRPHDWKSISDRAIETARAHGWSSSYAKFRDALYEAVRPE